VRRTAPSQANSQRFECDAQATILPLLRCGIARLTVNSKSPRCVSHPLQPKVCKPASLVAPSQIRPRIGDALRRQDSDAIPSTDKAAKSWAAFFSFLCVSFIRACIPSCACDGRLRSQLRRSPASLEAVRGAIPSIKQPRRLGAAIASARALAATSLRARLIWPRLRAASPDQTREWSR
jgi:hypothetical protein